MYRTIRKNATKKITAMLKSCPLIRECYISDMDDRTDAVTADRVMEIGSRLEFSRVSECDDYISLQIHSNWWFVAYKSLDAARKNLTPQAKARYGLS